MKNKKLFKAIVKISLLSTILAMSFQVLPANAAALDTLSDTMTRLQISTDADHDIYFNLAAGTDFDVTGFTDEIDVNFDPATTAFTPDANWVEADLTIEETAPGAQVWNPYNIQVGAFATPDCTSAGADDVAVAVDTTDDIFRFLACDDTSFTASSAGATIKITIAGDTGTGAMANPAGAGSYVVFIGHTDEGTPDANGGSLAVGIVDSDQVQITATIDPTLTFDLDTRFTDGEDAAPYAVDLLSISPSAVSTSDNTTINSIWVDLGTNATGGAVVTVLGTNTGLLSAVTGFNIASTSGACVAGTVRYGICVASVADTGGTLQMDAFYDGDGAADGCDVAADHTVGLVDTAIRNILDTNSLPASGGRAEILVKASISSLVPAASDYEDTLTFIATGTF
jgi:hypothetical protein